MTTMFTNIYVTFDSIENANKFAEVLVENNREEEFSRSSSRTFFMSFPSDARREDCEAEVEEFMWHLGYGKDVDYHFI